MNKNARRILFCIVVFLSFICTILTTNELKSKWGLNSISRGWDVLVVIAASMITIMGCDRKFIGWWKQLSANFNPHGQLLALCIGTNALAIATYAGYINNLIPLGITISFVPLGAGLTRGLNSSLGRQSINRIVYEIMAVTVAAGLGTFIGFGLTSSFALGVGIGILIGVTTGLALIIGFAIGYNIQLAAYLLNGAPHL